MEFRKMVTITLYGRQQKKYRCIEKSFGIKKKKKKSLLNSVGEGDGGMIRENDIEICIISYVK